MRAETIKLNLGSGIRAIPGWVNIDASVSVRISRIPLLYQLYCRLFGIKPSVWPQGIVIRDLRRGLPFHDRTVQAIFSSAMLEHLEPPVVTRLMQECHRVLIPGGIVRLIVPDLHAAARAYVEEVKVRPGAEPGRAFISFLAAFDIWKGHGLRRFLTFLFSRSQHRTMFDEWSLRECLAAAGFEDIQRKEYGQSRLGDIEVLEPDPAKTYQSLKMFCLEGVKPAGG